MKVQYDLEGAVIEQPKLQNCKGWKLKLKLGALLLVALLVGSAVGTIVFQRYYEQYEIEIVVHNDDAIESKEQMTSENEQSTDTWISEGSGHVGFKFQYEDGKWGLGTPAGSGNENLLKNDIEENYQQKSINTEEDIPVRSESQNVNPIVVIDPLVNPIEDFGIEATIMQFELNEDGLSIKYGDDQNNLTELQRDSGMGWVVRSLLHELFLATEHADDAGPKVDKGDSKTPEANTGEDIWNWSTDDGQIRFKFRFEDGQWSFEPMGTQSTTSEAVVDESNSQSSSKISFGEYTASSDESDDSVYTASGTIYDDDMVMIKHNI